MTTFGQYLKEKREAAEVTQKDLQKALGYKSSQFISNFERNVSFPPANAIPVIAKALNLTTQELGNKVVEGIIESYSTEIKTKYGV
jgi:transcriptional regulator with XRE-family HTH domain